MKNALISSLLLAASVLMSCAKPPPPPPAVPAPVALTDQGLFDLFSKFYCAQQRLPANGNELVEFAAKQGAPVEMSRYDQIAISSPRPVLAKFDFVRTATGENDSLLFVLPPSCKPDMLQPGEVGMAADAVRMTPPPGSRQLGPDQMRERWGEGPYPDVAWEDDQKLIVAVRFGEVPLSAAELKSMQEGLEAAYQQSVPHLTWTKRAVISSGDRSWIQLEFETNSTKGRLLNAVYATWCFGKLFTISFVAPAGNRADVGPSIEATMRSVSFGTPT